MSTPKSDDKTTPTPPAPTNPATVDQKPKKKLSLDIDDVSEVLERKISP